MAVTLSHDDRKQALTSIRRFCREGLGLAARDLQAVAPLEEFRQQIGPPR